MAEIPQDVKQMIDAFQTAESMEPAVEAKVLERLQARVAAGEMGPELPDKVGGAGLGAATKAVIVALVVAVPLAVLAMRGQPEDGTANTEVGVVTAEVEEPTAQAPTAAPPTAAEGPTPPPRQAEGTAPKATDTDDSEASTAAAGRTPARRGTSRRMPRPAEPPKNTSPPPDESGKAEGANEPTKGPGLDEELALVKRIRSAMDRGDDQRVLTLAAEHRRTFAGGVLTDEVKLMRMQALCGAGRRDEARREADAFLRNNPKSPLANRVRSVCANP